MGAAKDEEHTYKQLFGCELGALPFSYLGIPIHHRKLSNKEWKCIEERIEKKLSCWKGKLMSYGGRLVLINSVLTSMLRSSKFRKGSGSDLISLDLVSFGSLMRPRRNTTSRDGISCVDQKIKGGLVLRT